MAVTGAVALGTGAAMAAGAAAAAIRAARTRAKPTESHYGSQEDVYAVDPARAQAVESAYQAKQAEYQAKLAAFKANPPKSGMDRMVEEGQLQKEAREMEKTYQADLAAANEPVLQQSGYEVATDPLLRTQQESADAAAIARQGLISSSQAAEDQRQIGLGLINKPMDTTGSQMLAQYTPGAVSQNMANQVLNQNAQANLGAARASGALGLRNALNANAQAGTAAAGQMATQRALEEQQHLAARVGQGNAEQAQLLNQQQLGANFANSSLGAGLQAATTYGNQAIARENTAVAGLDSIRSAQLQQDIDYDTRRQQEQQRKSNALWGLAGALTGGASKLLGAR